MLAPRRTRQSPMKLYAMQLRSAPMKIIGPSGPTAKPEATAKHTPNHFTRRCLREGTEWQADIRAGRCKVDSTTAFFRPNRPSGLDVPESTRSDPESELALQIAAVEQANELRNARGPAQAVCWASQAADAGELLFRPFWALLHVFAL